jgi:hypothetical protein
MSRSPIPSTIIFALLSSISGQVFMVISQLDHGLTKKTYIKNVCLYKNRQYGPKQKNAIEIFYP